MNTNWLKARQTKYAVYLTIYVAVVVTVLVVANVLAKDYNVRYDGTQNKFYSLSEQTMKIVKQLKQPATITYFNFSGRFEQPSAGPGSMSPKDLLDRYANISSKIKVRLVDPDKNPEIAQESGIKTPPGTTLVQVGDRKELAKSLSEEGITGALIRDIKTATRTVCFVTGSGEPLIDDDTRSPAGLSIFKELLAKDGYGAKSINPIQKPEIPADCTVTVAAGPTGDYSQGEVDAIKKYVENGGRALIMMQPPIGTGANAISENPALTALLESWGVVLHKDRLLEFNYVEGTSPDVVYVESYPSQTIVNEMKRFTSLFPFTRSMEIKSGDKAVVEKVVDASESVVAITNLSKPLTREDITDPKNKRGPLTIAAAGTLNGGSPDKKGRFVVVGSVGWALNGVFGRVRGNLNLGLNMVNWLSSDEDLISIRPKEQEDRRVIVSGRQLWWVKTTSQALIPLSAIILGLVVWLRRRYEK